MKTKYPFLALLAGAALTLFSACGEFLDELPDNRAELDSPEKIYKLLVSAYPDRTYVRMCEFSSDNVDDQGADDPNSWRILEQNAYWSDIVDADNESNSETWRVYYLCIEHANVALEAIEKLGTPDELLPAKGEALLCRAYAHFCLTMLYCLPYHPEKAAEYLGIPYVTEPVTELKPAIGRGTLQECYEKIAADIEEGLPLIDDSAYSVPKYHFNRSAAYAFASRFYLYYMKWERVIECADEVLGSNPALVLRDWADAKTADWGDQALQYVDVNNEFSLMLTTLFSSNGSLFNAWSSSGSRFTHTYRISKHETYRAKRPMGGTYDLYGYKNLDMYRYRPYINDNIEKIYMPKWPSQWQTTDMITGVGYSRSTMVAFTTNETLLNRAEAYIHLKDYDSAVEDLDIWNNSYYTVGEHGIVHLTRERINEVYGDPASENYIAEYTSAAPTSRKPLHPHGLTVEPGEQEYMIQCLLFCRRIETLADGLRWGDVKRYGIVVDRFDNIDYVDAQTTGFRVAATLDEKDLRRAIQLPAEVITAGVEPNPRNADAPNHPFRQ